jgi:hypothetical protein
LYLTDKEADLGRRELANGKRGGLAGAWVLFTREWAARYEARGCCLQGSDTITKGQTPRFLFIIYYFLFFIYYGQRDTR